ncbi:MAG: FecR domain-containing protein, partial [Nitrospinae bacterium]|nr:FecR domain-containing protein [Nitrospinota bacterium]
MSRYVALFLALAMAFAPAMSYAAPQKMFAQVTRVTGTAHHSYAAIPDAKETTTVGARLFDGDRIVTDAGSRVELLLQSGGSMIVDERTTLVLTTLRKDDRGALAYSFNLVFGRIKSFLSRTSNKDQIEYATKAAIAGIAGTPPHVIEAKKDNSGKIVAGVFLLKGSKGQLFVKGLGAKPGTVLLNPGMGTTVLEGLAPLAPFALSPALLQSLEAIKATVMPTAPAPSTPTAPSAPATGGSTGGTPGAGASTGAS